MSFTESWKRSSAASRNGQPCMTVLKNGETKGTRKLTSPVFCANEMQRPDPREQKMQLEQQVCKGHRDTKKKTEGGIMLTSVLPSHYANLVQGQTARICLDPSVAVHVQSSNQATRIGLRSSVLVGATSTTPSGQILTICRGADRKRSAQR